MALRLRNAALSPLFPLGFAILLVQVAPAQTWVPKEVLQPGYGSAAAYDEARDRLVVLTVRSDTWEFDGVAWARRRPANSPPPRAYGTLVYDGARHRVLLFSGFNAPADTWEWDGVDWRQRFPATSPPADKFYSTAYDEGRQRVVLFGGPGPLHTWEWDGASWLAPGPAVEPSGGGTAAMAYDPVAKSVLLFGGSSGSGLLDETWEWDGVSWQQRHPPVAPEPRSRSGMAFDRVTQRIVLYGGGRVGYEGDTWVWDRFRWLFLPGKTAGRNDPTMYYSPVQRRVMLFGGTRGFEHRTEVWSWDGLAWEPSHDGAPEEGNLGLMAYDSARQRAVMLYRGDTWEWDGVAWSLETEVGPPRNLGLSMAYDAARHEVVVYGSGTHVVDNTWTWDGSSWTQHATAHDPQIRDGHAMAFDHVRQTVLLFGGDRSDATWEWDGNDWTRLQPATSPPGRSSHAMASDPVRKRILLYGGQGSQFYEDTWEWDGADWIQSLPLQHPPGRSDPAMAYDGALGAFVMFGGVGLQGLVPNRTWSWDGVQWRTLTPPREPAARSGAAMAYDSARQRLVMFGNASTEPGGTWEYGGVIAADAATYGSGCQISSVVPVLSAFGVPALGNPGYGQDLYAQPQRWAVMMFAVNAARIPLGGGCELLVDPATHLVSVPLAVDALGFASLRLPVPYLASIAGATFHSQAAVLEPFGIELSAGLRATIGE